MKLPSPRLFALLSAPVLVLFLVSLIALISGAQLLASLGLLALATLIAGYLALAVAYLRHVHRAILATSNRAAVRKEVRRLERKFLRRLERIREAQAGQEYRIRTLIDERLGTY